jgi:hypothetical protein
MGNLLRPLDSRVRMAFLSAVLVAVISAFLSFTPAGKQGADLVSHTIAAAAVGAGATATPTSGESGSQVTIVASTPTATPRPSPTTAPARPAATSTPAPCPPTNSGGQMDLHGIVASKGDTATSSFQYKVSSSCTMTVYVDANTTYEGASFPDGLIPGRAAEVTGSYRSDGTFLADHVHQEDGA